MANCTVFRVNYSASCWEARDAEYKYYQNTRCVLGDGSALVQSADPTPGMKQFQASRRHRQPHRIAASPAHNGPRLTHHPKASRYTTPREKLIKIGAKVVRHARTTGWLDRPQLLCGFRAFRQCQKDSRPAQPTLSHDGSAGVGYRGCRLRINR